MAPFFVLPWLLMPVGALITDPFGDGQPRDPDREPRSRSSSSASASRLLGRLHAWLLRREPGRADHDREPPVLAPHVPDDDGGAGRLRGRLPDLTRMDPKAKTRIEELRAEIRRHDRLYYVEARPEIGDREYDAALPGAAGSSRRRTRSSRAPIRRRSGWAASRSSRFATVTHSAPLLSLDNTYSRGRARRVGARRPAGRSGASRRATSPSQDRRRSRWSCTYENGRLVLGGDPRRRGRAATT